MHRLRLVSNGLALLLLAAASPEAAAQWAVSADVTSARFWGGSVEADGNRAFRPYRPTILGLGLERAGKTMGGDLRGYHASASLALEGPDAVVAVNAALSLYGVAAELSARIASLGNGGRVIIYGGPLVEVWRLAGESSNTVAGFTASIAVQVPLGGRFSGLIKAGAAVTASPFSTSDLDAGFNPAALWRREVSGRLRYGL